MQDLAELERRINAALQRIGAGLDASLGAGAEAAAPVAAPDTGEIERLTAELATARAEAAALRLDLQSALKTAPRSLAPSELEARVEQVTRQLDVQGLELQRLRKNIVQLRENLRNLRRAATDRLPDPDLINRAMLAELESIRVTRFAEIAELDEIIAELDPLISPEVPEHA